MKTLKITFALLFSALFSTANAQIQKNSFLLGGGLNLNYHSSKTTTTVNGGEHVNTDPTTLVLGIEPRIGYFIVNNFAIGLDVSFGLTNTKATYISTNPDLPGPKTVTTTTTSLVTGPFIRYYTGLSNSVYIFGEGSFGGGMDSKLMIDPNGMPQSVSLSSLQFGAGPGVDFFVNDFVAFEIMAKYTYVQSSYTFNSIQNATMGNNVKVSLGFQYYFQAMTSSGKKKPANGTIGL